MSTGSRLPSLGPRGEGWVYLQVALIIAVAISGAVVTWVPPAPLQVPLEIAGILMTIFGVLLIYRSSVNLGRSLAPWPRPKDDGTLVQTGLYGQIRHPIYTGLMLATLGWSLFVISPLALVFALALVVVLDLKARREEAWLNERYPEYAAYAARTHRFVPGVY